MYFNIRVYGILINDNNEVLLSDENRFGLSFTKFPGGGLKFGEGIKACLKREFQEELAVSISIDKLFYLTDFFQESAFDPNEQIVSIYYLVSCNQIDNIKTHSSKFEIEFKERETHRWQAISDLNVSDFMFPIDKIVVEKLT